MSQCVASCIAVLFFAGTVSAQMSLTCEPTSTTLFLAGAGTTIKVKTTPVTEGVLITPLGWNPGCIGVAPANATTDMNGEATFTTSCNGVECHSTITFSGTNPWTSCSTTVWCEDPCAESPLTRGPGVVRTKKPKGRAQASNRPTIAREWPERVTDLKHMVYDMKTRRVIRNGAPQKRSIATYCYVNTDTVGFFTSPSVGSEYIDWGVLGGTATTKCCGLSTIVSNFNFAYATASPDTSVAGPGASVTLTFYTQYSGFGLDSGNCPVASFAFSGLPGFSGSSTGIGSAYAFTVDVSGGGEFCLPSGTFGYGYRGDGNTGPLLCLTGDGAGGPEPCTGNLDVFDIWAPDTKGVNLGSFFFGGPPNNFTSWYGQIARADLSSSPSSVLLRAGGTAVPGSMVCSTFPLGGFFTLSATDAAGHLAAIAIAFDSAFTFTLGGGQTVLCLDLSGNGELYTSAGLSMTPLGGGSFTTTGPVPKNLDLCGFAFCSQTIFVFGVTPFGLSSACDVTVGG